MAYLRFSSEHDDRFYVYLSPTSLVFSGPDLFTLKDGDTNDLETASRLRQALDDYLERNIDW
jgi:hypothetical protein